LILRLYYLLDEQYAVNICVSRLGDVFCSLPDKSFMVIFIQCRNDRADKIYLLKENVLLLKKRMKNPIQEKIKVGESSSKTIILLQKIGMFL
jgi:hypothetical protein